MSVKRQATTELNRDNWDQEDEPEDMGTFKTAPKDELEKRVIRTAKRRSLASSNDPKKSVFSGFGGFQKTQPSSFDFLANLTNGNKNTTATSSDKNVTSNPESALDSKSSSTVPSGIFGVTATSTPTKLTFGLQVSPSSQTSTLFCVSSTNTTTSPSIFTVSKSNPLQTDSPFKINTSSSDNGRELTFKNINSNSTTPKMSPIVFNVATENSNKTLNNNSNVNSTVFKIQDSASNAQNTSITKSVNTKNETGNKEKNECDKKKLEYHSKLKGLNESVSKWIKKHVDETPVCILTPIFNDYEKYLKEIQDEYQDVDKSDEKGNQNDSSSNITSNKQGFSLFSDVNSKPTTIFGNTTLPSDTPTSTPGFKFGVFTTNTNTAVTSAPFSFTSNTTATTNGTTFTFGNNKLINFGSKTETSAAQQNDTNEEDEPPKVEFTPVVEENSVYDKRCKIFVKKDGNFVDKGVGTLYIKKIEETGKHQLLVRANTNLGTVLVNLILATAIPTQRMGKNNVMLVCIPTPESKPPPVPVLIRVKSSEEADELLETMDKYKT